MENGFHNGENENVFIPASSKTNAVENRVHQLVPPPLGEFVNFATNSIYKTPKYEIKNRNCYQNSNINLLFFSTYLNANFKYIANII